jgi:hypothetical protein
MFKIQHWPGANIMGTVSGFVTVFIFIPILVVQALKDKENQVQNFTILIFVLCFVAITFMMYALRVSKNVLTAFSVAAEGHIASTEIVEARNIVYLDRLQQSVPGSEDILEQAGIISSRTDALNDFIQGLTVDIVHRSHPDNQAAVDQEKNIAFDMLDNMDELYSVRVVIFGDEGIPGNGNELQRRINEYKEFLTGISDPELAGMINKLLDTGSRGELTWIQYCFLQAPMIGAVNVLTSIQSNVRLAEGEVLNQLLHRPLEQVEE